MTYRRLIIVGVAISPPGTMGGNTKIVLEYARRLPELGLDVVFVVPDEKIATYDSVAKGSRTRVFQVASVRCSDFKRPLASGLHYLKELRKAFESLGLGPEDVVLASSDFHTETWPLYVLQKEFGFKWIPSMFLFVPGPVENLRMRYGFPFLKYIVYYFYQRLMFGLQKARGMAFVVTNHSDFARFPKRFSNRLYAAYGGVNTEQILQDEASQEKIYDAVFCSRLHPQKGISRLLDIWKIVLANKPDAKLAVIGNGDPLYEKSLREKAVRLGLGASVEWLGYVNGAAKFKVYRQSKLLAHATVYDNNGMVAAEALCTGIPVVMNDIPALKSLYTTGCVKVPYGDNAAFAAAILDPGVSLSREECEELRVKWDWPNRAKEFAGFLEGL